MSTVAVMEDIDAEIEAQIEAQLAEIKSEQQPNADSGSSIYESALSQVAESLDCLAQVLESATKNILKKKSQDQKLKNSWSIWNFLEQNSKDIDIQQPTEDVPLEEQRRRKQLRNAIFDGNTDLVKELLIGQEQSEEEEGEDSDSYLDVNCIIDGHWTPLHCASAVGNVNIALLLLAIGADRDAQV